MQHTIKLGMFGISVHVLMGLLIGLPACGGDDSADATVRPVVAAPSVSNASRQGVAGSSVGSSATTSPVTPPVAPAQAPMAMPATVAGSSAVSASAAGSGALAMQPGAAGAGAPAATGGVSYHKDIRPIVEARCIGCHTAGGSGPFPLTTWKDVDQYKALMVTAVQSRHMPPWLADSTDCTKLRYDQRLTTAQLALFASWQAAQFPQGNEAEFKPLAEEKEPEIGPPTIVSKSPFPYQLRPNTEEYVCLQLDADFPADTYITGMDLAPEHAQFVHHAIVSAGTGACDALGITAPNIFSYRPGSRTLVFEKGDGLLVPAGTRLAIQLHYNTVGTVTGLPTDQSAFRMWTMPAGQTPERIITRYPHHSFAITIPVGAVDEQVSDTALMSVASAPSNRGFVQGEIIGVSPHMHVLGQEFKETLKRSDGKSVCLVNVPDWDFNWQIDYFFAPGDAIPVSASDSIEQDCVYSNRPEDQLVEDGTRLAPKFTTFGENTRDEMCLGYVWFRYKASDIL